jgi:cobalt-zinc-cadmium efflux system membrane fusion protein
MTPKTAISSILWLALFYQSAVSEELAVTPNQIGNLGIEFAQPESAPSLAAIEATARVIVPPGNEAFVSTPQAGLLARLMVSVGEEVTRGQVLAELQSPGFLALQREFLDALNASLLARSELDRDQQLIDEGIISARRLQETTTRAKIAATGLNEHRQLLQIAGLASEEIQALENSQKLRPALEIRAPFDGVVIDRMAVAGERLDTMSPVYRIADLSTLWLEIDVPQEKLAAVRPGMKVSIAGSAVETPAEVITIGRSIDPGTQAITVRAVLTEEGHGLAPGQFVSARIVTNQFDSASAPVWMLPAAAVTRSGDNHFIFVRTSDGIAVRMARMLGSDADHAFVSADIDGKSRIAVSGISAIKALWSAQSESEA